MFIEVLLIIGKKFGYYSGQYVMDKHKVIIHVIEPYYNRKEILIRATWMNPENIVRERSQ